MSTMHIIMMDKNISNANKTTLMKDIEKVDGVKWAFGLNSVFGANVPASMIPKDVKDMLQSDEQELVFVCSKYSSATDESNSQIAAINDLVKKYDSNGMVIGEAPLMKDLQDVTDIDLVNVNVASVAAIFIIIMLVFKSISVPIILVAVIEFAINVNMAIPFSGNRTSIRCKYRSRNHSAWCNRRLCDPYDEPLPEGKKKRIWQERSRHECTQSMCTVYHDKWFQFLRSNVRCGMVFQS